MRPLKSNHIRAALSCLAAFVVVVTPVHANPTDLPPSRSCVWEADDPRPFSAGDRGGEEEGAPPNLSAAFYRRAVTLVVTADGLDGWQLPISIVGVCDVPGPLAKGAAKLAGSNGVVVRLHRTTVWEFGALKVGPAATTLINGADAAVVRGRLIRPRAWRQDEDGRRMATFRAGRIDVTD